MLPLSARLAPARFLDPLVLVLVALGVALFFAFRGSSATSRSARRGRIAAWATWAGLWALSMPCTANLLMRSVETRGPDLAAALAGKDPDKVALIVLTAGIRTYDQSSPPRERLDAASTQRVLAASRLWNEHRFGVVILSGAPAAVTMGMRDLITTLGVPNERVVREPRSLNTRENAANCAALLHDRPQEAVVLLTSATHLRRAVRDFERAGLHVIPAAADVVGPARFEVDSLLPSTWALGHTQVCLHELLGYLRG